MNSQIPYAFRLANPLAGQGLDSSNQEEVKVPLQSVQRQSFMCKWSHVLERLWCVRWCAVVSLRV